MEEKRAFNLSLGLGAFNGCQAGAISEIPLFGNRAAAMSCCSEAPTNALEAVPKAFFRRCHHARACPSVGYRIRREML